jgi:hypothetical protein
MQLPISEMAVFCPETNQWQLRSGSYLLRLGSSSRDIRLQQVFLIEAVNTQSEETL